MWLLTFDLAAFGAMLAGMRRLLAVAVLVLAGCGGGESPGGRGGDGTGDPRDSLEQSSFVSDAIDNPCLDAFDRDCDSEFDACQKCTGNPCEGAGPFQVDGTDERCVYNYAMCQAARTYKHDSLCPSLSACEHEIYQCVAGSFQTYYECFTIDKMRFEDEDGPTYCATKATNFADHCSTFDRSGNVRQCG